MKLQFTNGYRPKFDQISRILQYLLGEENRKKISQKDIVEKLGIPTNEVENLISMMVGFGLVIPRVGTITSLGKMIIQFDPYFEKIESIWIIHYIVSSNPEWVVWYRVINDVLPSRDKFTIDSISSNYFSDLQLKYSKKTIEDKLPKEVGTVFASYTRSNFVRLGILEQDTKMGYYIRGNQQQMPALALLFCILYYRDHYSPGSSALNVEDVCLAENSPGRVLNIPEYQIRGQLDNLHSRGLIRLERFANLDQVRITDTTTQQSVLTEIYRR
ncbi:MAG TPA: DUF4007 family protein [Anaerolineales bacterium]|nr:DUF4007 family protein [Anaerolineales bacterium]